MVILFKIVGGILIFFAFILFLLVIKVFKDNRRQKKVKSENSYKSLCDYAGYFYLPSRAFRYAITGEQYPYSYEPFTEANVRVNIESLPIYGVLESLRTLAASKPFADILFYHKFTQQPGADCCELAYKVITKEQINSELAHLETDNDFFIWLKRNQVEVRNSALDIVDQRQIFKLAVNIDKFGLDVFNKIPVHNLETVLLGNGKLSNNELINICATCSNLRSLTFSQVYIDGADQEVITTLASICNNSKIDKLELGIYNDIQLEVLKSQLKKYVDVKIVSQQNNKAKVW